MLNLRHIACLFLPLLFCLACENKPKANDHEKHDKHDDHTHAPQNFSPGSHADWCGEHGVQESMCTRCNASLIPAFKKTGDWCEEHQMPTSQCLACNPKLVIKRPPKAAKP